MADSTNAQPTDEQIRRRILDDPEGYTREARERARMRLRQERASRTGIFRDAVRRARA